MKAFFQLLILASVVNPLLASYTDTINEGDSINELTLHGIESLLMTGGFINSLNLLESSSASFQNNIPEDGFTTFYLHTYGQSQVEINGGRFYMYYTWSDSIANVYAGVLGWIVAGQNSQIYLYGGDIYDFLKVADGTPVFHVFGYDLAINSLDYSDQLTGSWGDGSEINIGLYRDRWTGIDTRDYLVLHEIPEPAALLLLAGGAALARKRRRL